MLEAKKTNEGIVTSLADSDLVMAANAQGKFQPISVENLLKVVRDNIKVGGRNLLRDTSTSVTGNKTGSFVRREFQTLVEKGETYSLGITAQCNATVFPVEIYLSRKASASSGETRRYLYSGDTLTENKKRFVVTFVADSADLFNGNLICWGHEGIANTPVTISEIKLERGNIPTDWSPAPEDLSGGGNAHRFNRLRFEERRVA